VAEGARSESTDSEPLPKERVTPVGQLSERFKKRATHVSEEHASKIRSERARAHLCIDHVSVSFDGFKALTDLTITLDKGELRCIIGPNGAGKTTLMDVITGKTKPDRGHVFFLDDLQDLTLLNEHQIARRGIGRKFQRPTVFPKHTVRQNVELALAAHKGVWRSLFQKFTPADAERVDYTLEKIGLKNLQKGEAGSLAHGQKQWLEIGMLLAQNPQVLLVDEPIAGMTHQEIERTAELLRELAGDHTVAVIEHDMDFVRSIATDTVTVLHEGKVLAEGAMDAVQSDPHVIEVYLGE
jgi:urea transport system ATP-binding protein